MSCSVATYRHTELHRDERVRLHTRNVLQPYFRPLRSPAERAHVLTAEPVADKRTSQSVLLRLLWVYTNFASSCIIAAQEISLERTKPDPQQLPCPQQMIEFQCEILVPTTTLIWGLHTGEMLEFGVLRSVGDVRSSPDNVYSATLTGRREDDDTMTDWFFFTSTILIREPVNRTTLTCTGGGGTDPGDESTIITLSGEYFLSALTRVHLGLNEGFQYPVKLLVSESLHASMHPYRKGIGGLAFPKTTLSRVVSCMAVC